RGAGDREREERVVLVLHRDDAVITLRLGGARRLRHQAQIFLRHRCEHAHRFFPFCRLPGRPPGRNGFVRPSRRARHLVEWRALLRMRGFFDAINKRPHPEERDGTSRSASRRTPGCRCKAGTRPGRGAWKSGGPGQPLGYNHGMSRFPIAWPGVPLALLSAALFGISMPLAKVLLGEGVSPWLLAGLLYLGSGLGLAVLQLGRKAAGASLAEAPLRRADLPWLALV